MLLAPEIAPVDVVFFEIDASTLDFYILLQRFVEIPKDFNALEEYEVTIDVFEDTKEDTTMSTNTLYSVPRQSTGDVSLIRLLRDNQICRNRQIQNEISMNDHSLNFTKNSHY